MNKNVSPALLEALQPTDPKLFSWCTRIYEAAAMLQMPAQNPSSYKFNMVWDGEVVGKFVLTDNRMNRGMMAVMKDLDNQDVPEKDKKSICFRLMHMGELFSKNHEGLRQFIKPSTTPGFTEISEALYESLATAKLVLDGDEIYFDVDDVVRIAKAIEAAE